jgi:15-cis-phytoene synthase
MPMFLPARAPALRADAMGRDDATDHAADVAACRAVLRQHSKTFHAASLMLPRRVRNPASVLYGFCRLADDAVDVDGGRLEATARLRERVLRAYSGAPLPVPADRALAEVARRHGIPRQLFEALIDGLEWDAQGRRYETLAELQDYAARVAGTVGAMMAALMQARSPQALARACELGVAMQLSNIARDVGEDARMGRLYLPLQWLREAGIDPDAWLARPVFDSRLAGVVQRLLDEADLLYARVGGGVALLPVGCRPGINAARLLYAEIGREVERAGLDSVSRRAVVPGRRKLALLAQALLRIRPRRAGLWLHPLPAIAPLVHATAAAAPAGGALGPAWWQFSRRWEAVLGTFERLAQRDRQQRSLVGGARSGGLPGA